MAPNLTNKSNKVFKKTRSEKGFKQELINFRKFIEKNCENVGDNFTREARNIHYDKKKIQGNIWQSYNRGDLRVN